MHSGAVGRELQRCWKQSMFLGWDRERVAVRDRGRDRDDRVAILC
jgi:hypothetical protein